MREALFLEQLFVRCLKGFNRSVQRVSTAAFKGFQPQRSKGFNRSVQGVSTGAFKGFEQQCSKGLNRNVQGV
jgi:hypothetical protein